MLLPKQCISIRQPWAWAIAKAGKNVENRTWETAHRGPICIHAGKTRPTREMMDSCAWGLEQAGLTIAMPDVSDFVYGGIIAVAEITDCHWWEIVASPWAGTECFCWMLENVIALDSPVMCKGQLKIFHLPLALHTVPSFAPHSPAVSAAALIAP